MKKKLEEGLAKGNLVVNNLQKHGVVTGIVRPYSLLLEVLDVAYTASETFRGRYI